MEIINAAIKEWLNDHSYQREYSARVVAMTEEDVDVLVFLQQHGRTTPNGMVSAAEVLGNCWTADTEAHNRHANIELGADEVRGPYLVRRCDFVRSDVDFLDGEEYNRAFHARYPECTPMRVSLPKAQRLHFDTRLLPEGFADPAARIWVRSEGDEHWGVSKMQQDATYGDLLQEFAYLVRASGNRHHVFLESISTSIEDGGKALVCRGTFGS